MAELLENGTWILVPNDPSYNVLGNKWFYKIKLRADGTVERFTKGTRLSISTSVVLSDATEYRSMVEALQYVTMTWPDMCFSVNYVAQFMQSPTNEHLLLVKRILRYLKGTLGTGILLSTGDIHFISAYSDSEWQVVETQEGLPLVSYISSTNQLADLFTKGLVHCVFQYLTDKMLWLHQYQLEGECSVDSGIEVYQKALKVPPDSKVLRYAYAKLEESQGEISLLREYMRAIWGFGVNASALAHIS
ncbi:uncharacterized protein LOC113291874 [Papaver somniferum]|uniref:uncharacterized protein LOC113291874 n=1 Tax=Papaver somniferum TaxID=3469 RepID=UPI000E6F566C|nr:uncharacterized protein LOC113291874 [Papaver somniferum]